MSRHFIILLLALLAGPAWAQTTAAADPAAAAASAPAAAAPAAAASAPATPPPPPAPLDARVQQLKSELVRLNRDLLVLEEELLFPAGTQVAVFVSMDVGVFFELESVQVKMGNQVVGQHLYTPAEVAALKRGGVQRLWLGNLKSGTHAIDAFFTGRGPKQGEHQRDYKRGTTLSFEKTSEPRYIELRIRDAQGKLQPEFDVKVW
jgi:pyruvate/2-oxoglutarate dehydrogenase complex dihydrolipoamide acyltransferase (E2) component